MIVGCPVCRRERFDKTTEVFKRMSKKYSKKHQKVVFIITIILCVAVLAATLLVTVSSYLNTSPMFNDQDFAKALAEQLNINALRISQQRRGPEPVPQPALCLDHRRIRRIYH